VRCPECGFDNPDDIKFCTSCGSKLEAAAPPPTPTAPTNRCPQCGSEIRPEARFCDQCGASLTVACPQCGADATPGERFCSQCGQDLEQATTPVASATPQVERAFPLPNIIAAGVGAIMMLVSLAVTWYTPRAEGESYDLKISDLLDPGCAGFPGCPTWAGWGLPVVLMIVFASLVLISVLFCLWKKVATKSLWSSLGTLCAWCVVGNALYVLYWHYDQTRTWTGEGLWFNIVQVGSVLAFVGALVVLFSGVFGKKTT